MIQTFKGALHDLLHLSRLPAKQIADRAGKNYTRLSNCANDNQDGEHLYGKDIALLTNISENDVLIEHLSAACGGVFLRLPKLDQSEDVELNQHIIEMVQHLGDLSRSLQEAMLDKNISRTEGKTLEGITNELVQHCVSFAVEVGRKVTR